MVQALSDIIESEYFDKKKVSAILSNFSCKRDSDVETFLKTTAINFEKQRLARTFFLLDDSNPTKIYGYFSLTIRSFTLNSDVEDKDKMDLVRTKKMEHIAGYLLGQLARDDNSPKGLGKKLIEHAIERVKVAQREVAGRFIYLECKPELCDYYKSMGFKYLQDDPDDSNNIFMYYSI